MSTTDIWTLALAYLALALITAALALHEHATHMTNRRAAISTTARIAGLAAIWPVSIPWALTRGLRKRRR
ncbi:hypothetical protein [Streptomyces sp. NBC_01353]|uniref:hypothetical protein n=1 Tax=Streptomyces sp. NBC_01353 TaxID=2903835 RepID=UPI002E326ED0|nr:hypothetical protein [Streptomyces sp. NBC_01353]